MTEEAPILQSICPKVTVALSVFNGGSVLELAVRSVVNQTFRDWELLILDDGSTDGAIDRLPFLDDSRIVLVRDGQNKGLSGRLNQAIEMARGCYFARMDHDDICHPERFAKQVAFLEANPSIDLLATECVTMNKDERVNGTLPAATKHEMICAHPWLGFPMPHPSWMGRIEWLRQNRYSDPVPYCCDDNELLLRAHGFSRYHCLPERLLAYRVRSHTPWRKLWRTRVAQARVQVSYFLMHKQSAAVVLSLAATGLRIGRDLICEIRFRFLLGRKNTSDASSQTAEFLQWQRLIDSLKAESCPSEKLADTNE